MKFEEYKKETIVEAWQWDGKFNDIIKKIEVDPEDKCQICNKVMTNGKFVDTYEKCD